MQTEKVTLYFKQGTSDKVYSAALEDAGNHTFVVNFAYGRRGATLTTGTKTKEPVDYAAAKKIYDKLVKSKTAEGYVPGAESGPYVHTDSDARATGVQPQLLNFIEEAEALALLQDDNWWAQEKFDGKRMLLRKAAAQSPTESPTVSAINRSGITIGAPDAILQRAGNVAHSFLLDGEAVGERLFAFDLLELRAGQAGRNSLNVGQHLPRHFNWHTHIEGVDQFHCSRSSTVSTSDASPGHATAATSSGLPRNSTRAPSSPSFGRSSQTSTPRRTGFPR